MLFGHVRRTRGYLVVSLQSHEYIVIVNKASVNGGRRQASARSRFVGKVFVFARRRQVLLATIGGPSDTSGLASSPTRIL